MSRPWTQKWFDDCVLWYDIGGLNVLEGRYRHWCPDNAGIPVDETCYGFIKCRCFRCKCGELLRPHEYWRPKHVLEMFDDIFECPKSHWYNFWKHDWYNLGLNDKPTKRNGGI